MNTKHELEQEIDKTQKIIKDYCNHTRFFKLGKTDELRKVDVILDELKNTLNYKIGE
jgi:hypothetical protein